MNIQTYTTVNSESKMTVNLNSVSHIIEHTNFNDHDSDAETCWIHFQSGKSVHVRSSFDSVDNDLNLFHKSRNNN